MSEYRSRFDDRRVEAQPENDETQQPERGAEAREHSDRSPHWKLRDLRPEKDPMGAGKDIARGGTAAEQ